MTTIELAREILRTCVCSRTRMLDRILTQVFDDALRGVGIGSTQLTMLALVASLEGLRAVEIGQMLEMEKSTVSRCLAVLRKRGWVHTVERKGGGKGIGVTDQGNKVLKRAGPVWRNAETRARDVLGADTMESLKTAADSYLHLRAK
ncbi:MAG: MarR family transcriptional regulator [Gemmatimonadetes bacterium]|nr:MarR family transcriptional regulator [Gemmatimonadota bacterium]